MALQFPANPSTGDVFSNWVFDGTMWVCVGGLKGPLQIRSDTPQRNTLEVYQGPSGGPGWWASEILGFQLDAANVPLPPVIGQSNGLRIQAGTNAADDAILIENAAGTPMFLIRGDGTGTLGVASLTWDAQGVLSHSAVPVDPANVVNKAYVDTAVANVPAGATLSSAAPTNPFPGQMWFRTTDGALAVWLDSASGHWVSVTGATALVELADVAITNPQLNDVLTWKGTKFVNEPAQTGGGGGTLTAPIYVPGVANQTTMLIEGGQNTTLPSTSWIAAFRYQNITTAGARNGVYIQAGSNSSDTVFAVQKLSSGGSDCFRFQGDGSGLLGPDNVNCLRWDTQGHFTLGGTATLPGGGGGGVSLSEANTWTGAQTFSPAAGAVTTFNGDAWFNGNTRFWSQNVDFISAIFSQGALFNGPLTIFAQSAGGTAINMYGQISSLGQANYGGSMFTLDLNGGTDFAVNLEQAGTDGQGSVTVNIINSASFRRARIAVSADPTSFVAMMDWLTDAGMVQWRTWDTPMIPGGPPPIPTTMAPGRGVVMVEITFVFDPSMATVVPLGSWAVFST